MIGLRIGWATRAAAGGPLRSSAVFRAFDGVSRWTDFVGEHAEPGSGTGALLGVAAGLGEGDAAAQASAATARVLPKLYRPGLPDDPARGLLAFIRQMHDRLRAEAAGAGPVVGGASLTLAWALGGEVFWAQVGTTGLLLVREDRATRLTPVHTRREFAVRDGLSGIDRPDALAQAFLYGSRDLGDRARLRLEPNLDAGRELLAVGDALLLAPAEVLDALTVSEVTASARRYADPQALADTLADKVRPRCPGADLALVVARIDRVPSPTIPVSGRSGTGATFL